MKFLAHLQKDLKDEPISIYDVIRGFNGKNPEFWEKRTYYSLIDGIPMKAVVNTIKKKPHFAVKKGYGGNDNSGGGESIEHQLAKKVIYDNKFLKIKIGSIRDTIFFSKIIIEQPIKKKNSKNEKERIGRRADLYVQIANRNSFDFLVSKGLIIEIYKSNKVSLVKRNFYRKFDIPSIEIKINKEIKFNGNVGKLYKELKECLSNEINATNLHDPFWEKHQKERKEKQLKLQKEIEKKKQEQKEIEIKELDKKKRKEIEKKQFEKVYKEKEIIEQTIKKKNKFVKFIDKFLNYKM